MDAEEAIEALEHDPGPGSEGLQAAAKLLAQAVADALKVREEEVALLLLTSSGKVLKFVWPLPLSRSSASLPVDHKNAVASSVLQSGKGKVDNKLADSRHLKFFENVKGLETGRLPIQKMIALPLYVEGKPVGVLEVSRKGKSPADAGPNFKPEDAQALLELTGRCVPALARLIPDPFF
ncbi:MAG: GAF domain-containing protein [Acidobacteriota bacterium]|jgi:hypothetical protein